MKFGGFSLSPRIDFLSLFIPLRLNRTFHILKTGMWILILIFFLYIVNSPISVDALECNDVQSQAVAWFKSACERERWWVNNEADPDTPHPPTFVYVGSYKTVAETWEPISEIRGTGLNGCSKGWLITSKNAPVLDSNNLWVEIYIGSAFCADGIVYYAVNCDSGILYSVDTSEKEYGQESNPLPNRCQNFIGN